MNIHTTDLLVLTAGKNILHWRLRTISERKRKREKERKKQMKKYCASDAFLITLMF